MSSKSDLVAAFLAEDEAVKTFGVALIGLGRSGHFHLASLKVLTSVTSLKWVVDVRQEVGERIASETGAKWSPTIDAPLADPSVDFVIIASTTDTHFPFIMQSLRAKKAVFTEKPISHEVHEVQEAVDLAKKDNQILVCGYQRRCDVNFRAMQKQIENGSVGDLKMIKSCSRDNPIPPMEYLRTSGGIFQDMLIHDFDMQDWLCGGQVPESVTTVGACYNDTIREMGDIDTAAVVTKYKSGLITMIDTSRDSAYGYDQRVEVFGTKGMLTAKNEMSSTVELATVDGHLMPPAHWSFPQRYKEAYSVEIAEFVTLVQAGTTSMAHRIEQQHMLRHPRIVKTAAAAELSWRLGRTVHLSEDIETMIHEATLGKA